MACPETMGTKAKLNLAAREKLADNRDIRPNSKNNGLTGVTKNFPRTRAMPTLKNIRYEKFCQHIATSPKTGMSIAQAYIASGYSARDHAAESNASRLLKNAEVQARIAELVEPAAKKTRTTVQSLLDELELARAAAHDDRQFSAAVQAIAGKARLTGLDNRETGNGNGSGGQFDKCETVEAVVEALLTHHESPAAALAQLDELRGMIEAYASSHAVVISPEPARPRPDETAMALSTLRPARKGRR
jgi:phage terminase small subunit